MPTQYVANQTRPIDQDYTVEAAVTDQANREITGRGRFLATRGTFRIQRGAGELRHSRRRHRAL